MALSGQPSHTTSLTLPLTTWAALDRLRAERALATGQRPKLRDLLVEALNAFLIREGKQVAQLTTH